MSSVEMTNAYETAAERAFGRPVEASGSGLDAALAVAMRDIASADELRTLRAAADAVAWARNSGDGSVPSHAIDELTDAACRVLVLLAAKATP